MMTGMLRPTVQILLVLTLLALGCGVTDSQNIPAGFTSVERGMEFREAEDIPFPEGRVAMPVSPPLGLNMDHGVRVQTETTPSSKMLGKAASAVGITEAASSANTAEMVSFTRIIVRTVDLEISVADVSSSVEGIAEISKSFGGWTVSSKKSERHSGQISIRVPVDSLGEVLGAIRKLASNVELEIVRSEDVTDEYVDTEARLNNLEATEKALIRLFESALSIEDTLAVQKELTKIQGDIESLQGTIKLLERTAAYSLVNVVLRLVPIDMPVDAGEDKSASVNEIVRFRAIFEPPSDVEEFDYTWTFGDGSPPVFGTQTVATLDNHKRITATVGHQYMDDRDSPFIAELEIRGSGQSGLTEGTDKQIVTVTNVPSIEVFAGESRTVEEGQILELAGSFTRPEGLTDVVFEWDFGDGSQGFQKNASTGDTRATATHKYLDHRPFPYIVTLTVSGVAESGNIQGVGEVSVWVQKAPGWLVSDWSGSRAAKTAIRTLSYLLTGAGTFMIWLLIFSPVLGGTGAAAYVVVRIARRRRHSTRRQ